MSAPQCIGIILDGNRRWAKEHDLPTLQGHTKGYENVLACMRWVRDRGVKHLVVYAFSTENWKRTEEEVSYLMEIAHQALLHDAPKLSQEGFSIRFVGDRSLLKIDMQESMRRVEEDTSASDALTLWVCLSYGARAEIVAAAHAMVQKGLVITEEALREHFWSADMPDPDLIIRTGGEKRLSNFLLWQAAYSELFFIEPRWPDFTEEHLKSILEEYAVRVRRFGV